MEFNHADIVRSDASLFVGFLGGNLSHMIPAKINGRSAEEFRSIGGEMLTNDLDSLGFQVWSLVQEALRHKDDGSSAIRGRAAL